MALDPKLVCLACLLVFSAGGTEDRPFNRLSLKVMTPEGVPLTLAVVAQVKFAMKPKMLRTASQQVLGKSTSEIEDILLQTVEGHLKATLGADTKKTVVGGWAWAWWLVTDDQRVSLEAMAFNPARDDVKTVKGAPLTGVAQVRFMMKPKLLSIRKQFPGKSTSEIEDVLLQTLEGHLRAILGTLTVEEVYKDRDQFAQLVREVATPDVGRMGIQILSFTIKDVYDKVEYLSSIGKAQTAAAERDADIEYLSSLGKAQTAAVKKEADTGAAEAARDAKVKEAEASKAQELQAAKEQQTIRNEEIQIEIVERRKQIDIEEQEVMRKEKELSSIVRLPVEAEEYKVEAMAEGKRNQLEKIVQTDSEKIMVVGGAEEITKLASELPPAVQALTGVDLSKVIGQLPGASSRGAYPGYGQPGQYPSYPQQPGQSPNQDPLWGYFTSVAGQDGEVDAEELQKCLTQSGISGSYQPFNLETCRLMIAMLDRDMSCTMGFNEFKELWAVLNGWKQHFMSIDRDHSGTVDAHELSQAISSMGYRLSPQAMDMIAKRYSVNGKIAFDDYVACCVRLRSLTDLFRRRDSAGNGSANFQYDDFIQAMMSS